MKGLVIIPAYNEQDCIRNTIERIKSDAPEFDYVVINDCSTDNTLKILKEGNYCYLDLPVNLGIGGAVQTGYKYGYRKGYDVAVQVDADGQHNPEYLTRMMQTLEKYGADMVIGSRFVEKKGFQSSGARRAGIRFFKCLIRLLTGVTITDATSGLRMVNRQVMEVFSTDYPRDYPEPETTTALLKRGMKVIEIPVIMNERQGGVSSISPKKSIYYMVKVSLAIILVSLRFGRK